MMTPTILSLTDIKLFGIDLINANDTFELIIRFVFNFLITTSIIRFLYYPATKRKDYLFALILLSTTIFLLIFMLDGVKMKVGFALGLFAIFGIIRYRTNPIPIKEMTYIFVVIGLSVMNAMSSKKKSYAEVILINFIVTGIIYILEKVWLLKHESSKIVIYEKIELIKPGKYNELKADLEARIGLQLSRIEIGRVDFLKDTAKIRVYYFEEGLINQQNIQDEYNNDRDEL